MLSQEVDLADEPLVALALDLVDVDDLQRRRPFVAQTRRLPDGGIAPAAEAPPKRPWSDLLSLRVRHQGPHLYSRGGASTRIDPTATRRGDDREVPRPKNTVS